MRCFRSVDSEEVNPQDDSWLEEVGEIPVGESRDYRTLPFRKGNRISQALCELNTDTAAGADPESPTPFSVTPFFPQFVHTF